MGVRNEGLHYANSRGWPPARRLISYHFDWPVIHMNIAPPGEPGKKRDRKIDR